MYNKKYDAIVSVEWNLQPNLPADPSVVWDSEKRVILSIKFCNCENFLCDQTKAKYLPLWAFFLYYPINHDYWLTKSVIIILI